MRQRIRAPSPEHTPFITAEANRAAQEALVRSLNRVHVDYTYTDEVTGRPVPARRPRYSIPGINNLEPTVRDEPNICVQRADGALLFRHRGKLKGSTTTMLWPGEAPGFYMRIASCQILSGAGEPLNMRVIKTNSKLPLYIGDPVKINPHVLVKTVWEDVRNLPPGNYTETAQDSPDWVEVASQTQRDVDSFTTPWTLRSVVRAALLSASDWHRHY